MSFAPLNLFITGGAGFIGTNFVRHWLANTREGRVIVFDALTYAGNLDNLSGLECNPRFAFVRGDICDEAAVRALMEAHQIDTIVHFAAESHVDRSILGPDDFIRTNVVGTHALLKAAKTLWLEQKTCRRIASITYRPTKSTDRWGPKIRPSPKIVLTHPTPHIPRARPPRTIWCAHIMRPTASIRR